MKHLLKYRRFLLMSFALLSINVLAYPQDKKYKARVAVQYIKIMNTESFISISAKYKVEKDFELGSNLEFNVYKLGLKDSLVFLGKVKTNLMGKAKFPLNDDSFKSADAASVFTYIIKIENNNRFEDDETTVSFSYANLVADVQIIDSVNQIRATLTDASGKPLAGQPLKVGLQRLYAPLQIGKESYETDEKGSVIVPIGEPMPGIDGKLTFETVLSESDAYGTIKAIVVASIGTTIVEKSTYNDRTMWSRPAKTPFYLLIFPNLIILGVWVPILILVFNLYRISKSKTT